MIKVLLFDADGVLINSEMATVELARKYKIPQTQSKEFFEKEWDACLRGLADSRKVLKPYLQKWGWQGSVEDYLNFWFEFEHKLDLALINYIQNLRKSGIICAVATDQDKNRASYMLEKMGFQNSFDELFASSHIGYLKTELGFFNFVLKKYGLPANEFLFWDDSPAKVEVAKSGQLNAEIYENFSSFKKKMKEKYKL